MVSVHDRLWRRAMNFLVVVAASISLFVSTFVGALGAELDFDPGGQFDQVWRLTAAEFFDEDMNGVDWNAMKERFRPLAVAANTHEEFVGIVNQLLGTLSTSHTQLLAPHQPEYFQLVGIFEHLRADPKIKGWTYEGIGITTKETSEGVFVTAVFDSFPAHEAGLLYGDRLVAVDGAGFQAIASFQGKAGQDVTMRIQRQRAGIESEIRVRPVVLDGREMFLKAMQGSVTVLNPADTAVGYVHVWSFAGTQYQAELERILLEGPLKDCRALVLDLRDGWGGADIRYFDLFRDPVVQLQFETREGIFSVTRRWRKPVVLLVNEGTRSGKEVLAHAFDRLDRGPIVGAKTAGAVMAGKPTCLDNGDILYCAVGDVLVDGKRLEGQGVPPTVPVERPLEFAGGRDPQLEAALEVAGKLP